jgi:hypothetical protein
MSELQLVGTCGPARHFKAATVFRTTYPADGSIALVSAPGLPNQQTYTVCLAGSRNEAGEVPEVKPDHVWIKSWSENEGVVQALEEAGIIELTGQLWPCGYAVAFEGRLLK